MAGGGGTRFWPWSRETRPKQFLPIISSHSMVWETVNRVRTLVTPEKIYIVTSSAQLEGLRREVPQVPKSNHLAEPIGRNTAPCLGLAALHIQKRDPEAVMIALPADHFVADRKGFLKTLRAAIEWTEKKDDLVTLGVRPTEPETGYGYIQKGKSLGQANGIEVFKVEAFQEKPTLSRARTYIRRGDYFWNSGIFIWRVKTYLNAMEKFLPQVYEEMIQLAPFLATPEEEKVLAGIYSRFQPISVDYGIMEKASNVALVEAGFPWNDVGSWAALGKIWPKDKNGNSLPKESRVGQRKILAIDSSGCLIRGEEKLIAVIGLKDMIVVEAGNAFLVCPRERSQEVRRILAELQAQGFKEYL